MRSIKEANNCNSRCSYALDPNNAMELHYSAIEAIHPRAFQEEAFKRGLRCDGRKLFECRRVGVAVLPRADHGNSVLASIGSTQVICGLRISRVDCGPVAAPSPAIPEDVAEPMEPDSSTRAAPSSEAAAHEAHFEVQYSALCGQHSARAGSSGVGASSVGARQPREAMRVSRLLQRVFQTSKCLDLAKLPSVPSDNEASGAAKRQAWKLEVTCIVVVDDGATDAACVTAAAACLSAVTFPTGNDSIGSSCNLLGRVPVALSLAVVATKATVDGT